MLSRVLDFDWRWFNADGPHAIVTLPGGRCLFVAAWSLFNRVTADGDHYWGVGVLQIGKRHLCYVGANGVSILFVGRTT